MIKKNLIVLIVLMATAVTIFTSCGEKIEVRDRAFVNTLSIERTREGVGVKATAKTAAQKGEQPKIETYSAKEMTIFSAIEKAGTESGKKLFTGHVSMIAISGDMLANSIITFVKSNQIPPNCFLLYGEIDEESAEISSKIDRKVKSGYLADPTLANAADMLLSTSGIAIIPYTDGNELTSCLINANSLLTVLTHDESIGAALLTRKQKGILIPITVDGKKYSYFAAKSTPRIKTNISSEKLEVKFTIKIKGKVLEAPELKASEEIKSAIKGYCEKTLRKTIIENGADIFGIEKSVSQLHPNFWRNRDFQETLKNAVFSCEII